MKSIENGMVRLNRHFYLFGFKKLGDALRYASSVNPSNRLIFTLPSITILNESEEVKKGDFVLTNDLRRGYVSYINPKEKYEVVFKADPEIGYYNEQELQRTTRTYNNWASLMKCPPELIKKTAESWNYLVCVDHTGLNNNKDFFNNLCWI